MVKPIEQFAADVWADLPNEDENGARIYRGPIVDLLVFDLIVTLFKTLLTNGGCLNPNPTPAEVRAAMRRPPRYQVFRRRAWNVAVRKQYAASLDKTRAMRQGGGEPRECRLCDVEAALAARLEKVTVEQVAAAMAQS